MNGAADMGGMMGFGAVQPDRETDPLFHADWERRVLAMAFAMAATGQWNLDMTRFARESLPPATYLSSSYFEIWYSALLKLMLERNLVQVDEVAAGHVLYPPSHLAHRLTPEEVRHRMANGRPATRREADRPSRYKLGDRVRAKNIHPTGHTRLPRYVRGRVGTVELLHGVHVFPDASAKGEGEKPQWLYTVRFDGRELWGEDADPTLSVSVDAWESYLEALT